MAGPTSASSTSGRGPSLRLLVVADLAPGREAGPLEVSGDVSAALAALSPTLAVASRPGADAVSLRFGSLDDFHPDAVARQLPAAPAAPAPAGPLDSLLAQVEVPTADGRGARAAEIVQAEPFRALEADWRGLDFLVRRAAAAHPTSHPSTHREIQIELLAASKEAFLDAFFETVFAAEHDGASAVPLSAVVLGYEFDRSPADVETLRHAARMGESLRVPFLAAVGAPFWGLRQAKLLAGLPDLVRKVQGPEYAKWNGLRSEEASLWLCLAANRLLLRNAWSETGSPLWGCGAYALAAVLVQGFAAGGVGFPLAGEPSHLPDLPGEPPVEVLLPDAKTLELARIGLSPLTAGRGETTARFTSLPTLHAPKRYDKEEATRSAAIVATLPYQAFGGAAAHALQALARETGGGLEPDEVQRRFTDGLLAFLAGAEEAPAAEEVEVEVQPSADDPGIWEVMARLRPKFQIYGGEVDLVLGSVVPR